MKLFYSSLAICAAATSAFVAPEHRRPVVKSVSMSDQGIPLDDVWSSTIYNYNSSTKSQSQTETSSTSDATILALTTTMKDDTSSITSPDFLHRAIGSAWHFMYDPNHPRRRRPTKNKPKSRCGPSSGRVKPKCAGCSCPCGSTTDGPDWRVIDSCIDH